MTTQAQAKPLHTNSDNSPTAEIISIPPNQCIVKTARSQGIDFAVRADFDAKPKAL
ncbi:MAG: hypothetical protein ACRCZF_00190 [Gemmataceae bacterium]